MNFVDLSHPVESGMPVYPDTTPVEYRVASTIADDGALSGVLELQTHAGTHVDAPAHMREGGRFVDEIDVEAFRFDARCVDCTHRGAREAVTTADLPAASVAASVDLLVFETGWSEHWGTDRYRDHPYLGADVAAWCAEHDCAVGVDGFSPDPTPSADPGGESDDEPDGHPAHDALFAGDQVIVENLANLHAVPDSFVLHAYPLAIADGDGSPVRAVAEC